MFAATVTAEPHFTEIGGNSRILPAKSKASHILTFKLDQGMARSRASTVGISGGDHEPKTPDERYRR